MADEVASAGHALPLAQVEPLFAQAAGIVLPLEAILEVAHAVDQLVVGPAGAAELVVVFLASVDDAGSALQLVVGEALDADPAIVLEAAGLQFLAAAIFGEVVAALA